MEQIMGQTNVQASKPEDQCDCNLPLGAHMETINDRYWKHKDNHIEDNTGDNLS